MQKVSLKAIADEMEALSEEYRTFYNRATGEFKSLSVEYMGIAEEIEDGEIERYSDWERDEISNALEAFEHRKDYIELPDREEINEYSVMEDFIESLDNARASNMLSVAIQGRGAFRRFKDTAIRCGVIEEWYKFRFNSYCEVARRWCVDNEIDYCT